MFLRRISARVAASCVALLSVTGIGIVNAPSAAAHYSDCPDTKFCLWQDSGYEGLYEYSYKPKPDLGDFNDRATSFWNRTSDWISVYRDNSYGYCLANISPGASSYNVGDALNDRISSFRPGRCTPAPGVSDFSTF